jgi:hypothetical protein
VRFGVGLVLYVVGIAMSLWVAALNLRNPDMTEVRLILTFWPEHLIAIGCLIGGMFVTAIRPIGRGGSTGGSQ